VPGLSTTFALLTATPNEAALPLLAAALDSASPQVRAAGLRGILERRAPAGLRQIVERTAEWSEAETQIVREYHGRLAPLLREGLGSSDGATIERALNAAIRFREYDVVPLLINAVEDEAYPHRQAAAAALPQLADELFHELATTRDVRRRRDPQIARNHTITALEQSVVRFPKHGRREPIEAFLQLAGRENAALSRILTDARDPCFAAVVETLLGSERPGVLRLLLGFLDDPRPPIAGLQTLFRRSDHRFVELLLKKIGPEPSPTVRMNLRRIDAIAWLSQRTLLHALEEPQQTAAVALVQSSGLKPPAAFAALDYFAEWGKPAARAAAVEAMNGVRGPEANARVLRSLEDDDPGVRAAALIQLRPRGIPGSLAALITALDSPEPTIRDAVRTQLQEFCFRRFLPAFDLLEDSVRRTTGVLVAKVDPTSAAQLREELTSSQTKRRIRALEAAAAMELVAELEDAIIAATADADQGVRYEAARALATASTTAAVAALQELQEDASYAVREAARESLAQIATTTPVPVTNLVAPLLGAQVGR
jgi:HEAT repeat protein